MRRTFLFLIILGAGLVVPRAGAQTAVVYKWPNELLRIDPSGPTITTFLRPNFGRGHCMGHDGHVYMGTWNSSGPAMIHRLNLGSNSLTTIATGTSQTQFGAPYVPCLNFEASGGPGLWVFDGVSITTAVLQTKACLVDIGSGAIQWDLIAALGSPGAGMADAYRHPLKSSRIISVGLYTIAPAVEIHRIYGQATVATLKPLGGFLNHPVGYDAFIHEDRQLYCWTNHIQASQFWPTFVGLLVMNTRTGAQTSTSLGQIPVSSSAPWAGAWNEPWEKPGRIAYIACDVNDNLYKVDLLANPPVAVSLAPLPPGMYIHAREIEEAQLASWRKGASGRVFHLNFGAAMAGKPYVLAPSVSGYLNTPIVLQPGGLELWLAPDAITVAATQGHLGYAASGVLDASGTKTVKFDVGARLGFDAFWAALVIDKGRVLDISNLIVVSM